MKAEFRRARIPAEIRGLMAFDRKVFSRSDLFTSDDWKSCVAYWMLIDGIKVGCCAFEEHVDFGDDFRGVNRSQKGTLYICTTGILPEYRGKGFGSLLKSWELAYARYHGFQRVVTNMRSRNTAMMGLNRKFGFRILRSSPGYYSDPADAAVVMELRL